MLETKTILPEAILQFNTQFVYFTHGKTIYRARRKSNSHGGRCTFETNREMRIREETIKPMSKIVC